MLIDSLRMRTGDKKRWDQLAAYDARLATSYFLTKKEDDAINVIRDFASKGDCYIGVSWGKDSVCVAQLAMMSGVDIEMVSVVVEPVQNPDSHLVRDSFLSSWPRARYMEIREESLERKSLKDGKRKTFHSWDTESPFLRGMKRAAEMFGGRHISGVRASESRVRKLTMHRNGTASVRSCRPIGYWSDVDVFAFLSKYDLPIHPVYSLSLGGVLDRSKLRVDFIDGLNGRGFGREEWEATYYPDALRNIKKWSEI